MKVITIMPDFGMGPYAWQKDDSDNSTAVGPNIADAVCGFSYTGYTVSKALEADFATWVTWFEREALNDPPAMDWEAFHRQGIALARRLKAELGAQVRVVYDVPVEDPSYRTYRGFDVRTEILRGGKLRLIAFRNEPANMKRPVVRAPDARDERQDPRQDCQNGPREETP